jgi:hypothetical protein
MCPANWKARVGFISPRRTRRARRHEGKDSSSRSSFPLWLKTGFILGQGGFGRDDLPVVREGCAAAQPYRTEYRSVTPGNGNVLAEDRPFPPFSAKWSRGARPSRSLGGASRAALSDKDMPGGTPPRRGRRTRFHRKPVAEKLKRFKVIKSN